MEIFDYVIGAIFILLLGMALTAPCVEQENVIQEENRLE